MRYLRAHVQQSNILRGGGLHLLQYSITMGLVCRLPMSFLAVLPAVLH